MAAALISNSTADLKKRLPIVMPNGQVVENGWHPYVEDRGVLDNYRRHLRKCCRSSEK